MVFTYYIFLFSNIKRHLSVGKSQTFSTLAHNFAELKLVEIRRKKTNPDFNKERTDPRASTRDVVYDVYTRT